MKSDLYSEKGSIAVHHGKIQLELKRIVCHAMQILEMQLAMFTC